MSGKVNIGAKGTAYNKGCAYLVGDAYPDGWSLFYFASVRFETKGKADHKNGIGFSLVDYLYPVIRSV